MKSIGYLIIAILLSSFLGGCTNGKRNNVSEHKKYRVTSKRGSSEENDSVFVINGQKLIKQPQSLCGEVSGSELEDLTFLNTVVCYFKIDTVIPSILKSEKHYKEILTTTKFLNYSPNDFKIGNYTFQFSQTNIDKYGNCFIAKFFFKETINSAQKRTILIVNHRRSEITIWDFDNVTIKNGRIRGDFNLKGNHSFYDLTYSENCKIFIPLKR